MGLNFQFATASKIIFGNNSAEKIPGIISGIGKNILLVTGKKSDRAQKLIERFPKEFKVTLFNIPAEPAVQTVDSGVELAKRNGCNVVVGFGGGSAIDSAKAIAALVTNKGEVSDFLEVIGKGKPLTERPLPCIAVPTTSGTGAEITKNAVIKSTDHKVKVSLRSELMYPDFAIVDPVLTLSMPSEITASTGIDALTHLLETFVSNQSNPFIDMFCREGMQRISRSLMKAFENGENLKAREDMAMASLLGGMALANVKLGAVHGFAGPMGGMFPMPHGAVCACLLPPVMEINLRALSEIGDEVGLQKYNEAAAILTGNSASKAADGIEWTKNLVNNLKIPKLSQFGLSENEFGLLTNKAKAASSMKGNPVVLSNGYLKEILSKVI